MRRDVNLEKKGVRIPGMLTGIVGIAIKKDTYCTGAQRWISDETINKSNA